MRRQYARLARERTEHLMFGAMGWMMVLGTSFLGMGFVSPLVGAQSVR